MANPRIEEVDDDDFADDPEEMDVDDLDAFDFARPKGNLEPAMDPSASQINPADIQAMLQQSQPQAQAQNQWSAQQAANMQTNPTADQQRQAQEQSKTYQCVYPVYFDATRSKAEGRRVKKEDAVANPLAREIVDALSSIAQQKGVPLRIVFEPHKTHPKDWANPGRVRVLVKRDGKAISSKIANKHYLYTLISAYLRAHPTTEKTPQNYRMQGMPPPSKDTPTAPAIPRGFKMGTILPLHSPALSGGGVSDNFLKDMMGEMGGQLPPGMEGMAGMLGNMGGGGGGQASGSAGAGQQKKVKDKKKK